MDNQWGGINVEAQGNDSIFAFGTSNTTHYITGSYRASSTYLPININVGNYNNQLVLETDGDVRFGDNSGRIDKILMGNPSSPSKGII